MRLVYGAETSAQPPNLTAPMSMDTGHISTATSSGPRAIHRGISFLRNFSSSHSAATDSSSSPSSPSSQPNPNPELEPSPLSRLTPDIVPPPLHSAVMTRSRSETGPTPTSSAMADESSSSAPKNLPTLRFIAHQDPRSNGRPSLQFPTITRTLPDETAIIRVGRYSERDKVPEILPNVPSAAPVGFKSKVVSRKHCELWCKDGSWFIKDVKSSSGTFLNHIRLSQPNVESKPFRIKDGDIIQLGIDFRGGEEMIFRCVKIRVECNRGWQQGLNTFNKQTHQRLRNLAKSKKEGDTASTHTSECSICLMSIAPCQSLFVAPCSHVWHYKCIRPMLNGPTWPNFLCPNCRAVADLEEDVEEPGEFEDWNEEVEQSNGDTTTKPDESQGDRHVTPRSSMAPMNGTLGNQDNGVDLSDLHHAISHITISDPLNGIANQQLPQTPERHLTPIPFSVTQPVAIDITGANYTAGLSPLNPTTHNGLTPDRVQEGPMTPRNDVGPFVLDGSAGRGAANLRDSSPPVDSANIDTSDLPPHAL